MPFPNVSTLYQRISGGSEGGHEFARFIKTLLSADYHSQEVNFISESDASGDYRKVDGYIKGDVDFPDNIIGFQFKFFPAKFSDYQKQSIIKSIESAINENDLIQDFILITPEDLMKEEQKWLDQIKSKYEKHYWAQSNGLNRKCHFKIQHWGHTKIVELSLKHEHIGRLYFPELFTSGSGSFKLSYASMDCQLSSWVLDAENGYHLTVPSEDYPNQVSDPIFDFAFKNSTSDIHLLHSIEIHIEKVWSTLKGLPKELFLRSLGAVEYEIDFKKPINKIEFPDPLLFSSNMAVRFHLQLSRFVEKCPGNNAQIKFWFHFDERSIPTDSFFLGM
tara:strand:+ start:4187 stop:5185 length:999 start_codon:yes stop_codon:yes gene_type:complete